MRRHLLLGTIVVMLMCLPMIAMAGDGAQGTYDDSLNVDAALVSAISEAEATGKHILVIWGANWCPWCKSLSQITVESDSVCEKLASDFIVLKVSIGQRGGTEQDVSRGFWNSRSKRIRYSVAHGARSIK